MPDRPEQPPEGALIQRATDRGRLSVRKLAAKAGMSEGRWRQIVNGYQSVGRGEVVTVTAPPLTLARMAGVVGVDAAALRAVGRADAADELERLREEPSPTRPDVDADEILRQVAVFVRSKLPDSTIRLAVTDLIDIWERNLAERLRNQPAEPDRRLDAG